jgi:lactoylglutathione lyase
MQLGAFSISLTVKDIEKSKVFYEKLGFSVFHGNQDQKWLIMKNGDHIIGLFQGMFENNIMTFNPGWNQNGENIDNYVDAREIAKNLKENGITPIQESFETESGPAHFTLQDPDGNYILIDQHV